MDSDFSDKLKNILSDPEALAKISAIASNLGAGNINPQPSVEYDARAEQASENPASNDAFSALPQNLFASAGDPRISLLNSLKPLLREEKRERIDALTRALMLASVMKNFRK